MVPTTRARVPVGRARSVSLPPSPKDIPVPESPLTPIDSEHYDMPQSREPLEPTIAEPLFNNGSQPTYSAQPPLQEYPALPTHKPQPGMQRTIEKLFDNVYAKLEQMERNRIQDMREVRLEMEGLRRQPIEERMDNRGWSRDIHTPPRMPYPMEHNSVPPPIDTKPRFRDVSLAPTNNLYGGHIKLKASDLPKFRGKDTEDIDQWIDKVTAIFQFSGATDAELLRHLPLILQDNALTWFTQLGSLKALTLVTWLDWVDALKKAFRRPNHAANLRRQCLYRTLKANESCSDYFQDKQNLQHYVYPPGTPEKDLIEDMLSGIPQTMQPLLKASLKDNHTLEDFRRILIDLEPGLRPRQTHQSEPKRSSNNAAPAFTRQPPRTPCVCGGMHWRTDCPHNGKVNNTKVTPRANIARTFTPQGVNATPLTQQRWKTNPNRTTPTTNTASPAVNIVQTRASK
jgi:hypothetical protein